MANDQRIQKILKANREKRQIKWERMKVMLAADFQTSQMPQYKPEDNGLMLLKG